MHLPTFRRGAYVAAVAVLALFGVCGDPAPAQDKQPAPPSGAHVFVHPEKLTAKDVLSFGETGERIEIKGETTLVWVDLSPGARYGHPTECVLISTAGTRVVKGDWWLVLNGKALFRDGKSYSVGFPARLGVK